MLLRIVRLMTTLPATLLILFLPAGSRAEIALLPVDETGRVTESFGETGSGDPVRLRCLTPLIAAMERISEGHEGLLLQADPTGTPFLEGDSGNLAAHRSAAALRQNICTPPASTESHISSSGRFVIHYTLEGDDAVPAEDRNGNGIPDYVEKTAFAADSSWNHLVGRIGFVDPVPTGSEPYEIHFKNFGFYGLTCTSGASTFMVLHSNFEGFPENDHPEGGRTGALYATTAHELKHAIQYATNRWRGDTQSWIEMDAVLAEEFVFDDVNDYHHYLRTASGSPHPNSIFGNPANPIPGNYYHATWMLYFAEKFGAGFWVDVWWRLRLQSTRPFLEAVREILEERHTSFAAEHTENLLWHLLTGPDAPEGPVGFGERREYPPPRFQTEFHLVPDSTSSALTLMPLAASFVQVRPSIGLTGNPRITLTHPDAEMGMGVVGYFLDGSMEHAVLAGHPERTVAQLDWRWGDLERLEIAVVNTREKGDDSQYQFTVESVLPEEFVLYQNWPNPFQRSTRIRFSLDRDERIRLELFDLLGRRVKILADDTFTRGYHTVELDAADLASGVYIYRIVAAGRSHSRKMVRIR